MNMENIQEKNQTAAMSFKFMTDAMERMQVAKEYVEYVASCYEQKLEFVPLGVENGKICFRVACRKYPDSLPEMMIRDIEEKSNFELIKSSSRLFCNEYAASVY